MSSWNGEAPVTVSLKEHEGYDSALLTYRASSNAEVMDLVAAGQAAGIGGVIGGAAAAFRAAALLGRGFDATPMQPPTTGEQGYAPTGAQTEPQPPAQPQAPTQPAQQPYGVATKTCPHGTKTYKTAPPNSGKTWKGWFCPARKGDATQCPVEWDNAKSFGAEPHIG